jgi:hypothetical protein
MRGICILEITVSAILLSTAALAQAPPTTKPPVAPMAEQLDRNACAQTDTPSTMGKGAEIDRQTQDAQGNLSDRLARSGGVISTKKCRSGDQATDPARQCNARNPAARGPRRDQSIQPK